MAFAGALNALASGGGGAPPAQPASQGSGPPPSMPGALPPATMMGKMPVGNPGIDAKGAASQAVLDLREAQGHFPNLKDQIDGMIEALTAAAKASGGPPPSVDSPDAGPAVAQLATAPTMESGTPGSF